MKKILPFALAPLSLLIAAQACADDQDARSLDPVVVTASRVAQPVSAVIPATTVITREQIEQSPGRDVGDLLRSYAGLQVARLGGPGQQTSIFTRGTNSDHTLVMIDGTPITDGVTGQSFIQNLPLEQIERIEVVKGPMSSLYGSEAIGGVINIISRQATGTSGSLRLTAGNHGLREAALTQHIASQNSGLAISAEGLNYDGDSILTGSNLERGYERRSLQLNGYHRIGDLKLTVLYRNTKGTTEYFDFGTPADQDTNQTLKQVGVEWSGKGPYSTRLLLSENIEEIEQNQSANFVRTERRAIDWQHSYVAGNNTLTAGATYTRQRIENLVAPWTDYEDSPDTRALYLQNAWQSGRWSVVAAGRAEHDDRYGNYQTGNLGGSYAISAQQKLYVSAGTAFHAPDGMDLSSSGGLPLDPERSRSLEIGTKFASTDTQWDLAVFQNDIKDLINGWPAVNIAKARIQGVEASLRQRVGTFTVYGNASYLRPIDKTTDEDLSRRPRRNATIGIEQQHGAWRSFAEVVARSRSDNTAFDNAKLPGFATVNLGTRFQLSRAVSLGLAAENLLDKEYGYGITGGQTYLAQPRQVKATVVINY